MFFTEYHFIINMPQHHSCTMGLNAFPCWLEKIHNCTFDGGAPNDKCSITHMDMIVIKWSLRFIHWHYLYRSTSKLIVQLGSQDGRCPNLILWGVLTLPVTDIISIVSATDVTLTLNVGWNSDAYGTQKWKHLRSFEVVVRLVRLYRISGRHVCRVL